MDLNARGSGIELNIILHQDLDLYHFCQLLNLRDGQPEHHGQNTRTSENEVIRQNPGSGKWISERVPVAPAVANIGARGQGDWCAAGLVAVIGPMGKHCEDHAACEIAH